MTDETLNKISELKELADVIAKHFSMELSTVASIITINDLEARIVPVYNVIDDKHITCMKFENGIVYNDLFITKDNIYPLSLVIECEKNHTLTLDIQKVQEKIKALIEERKNGNKI